ncbi:MAG: sigma-70 family RNA polymerase sigma factor [bacterium]
MDSITDESITDALASSRGGSPEAIERLVPLVYDALRAIAHRQLRAERPDHTLSTTGLVHEAYIRLVDQTRAGWRDRTHFFAVAARVMRRVLVDYARRRGAVKRRVPDGDFLALDASSAADEQAGMMLALDEALSRLAMLDERQSRIVEYRFFAGLTEEEIADLLGISSRTVRTDWVKAKGWLFQELREE